MKHIFSGALSAYFQNIRLLALFSIPFLVAFPLALLLPNYTALSAIFLRLGSLGSDVSMAETGVMFAIIAISLLLFSFALVAVNSVVKAQRAFVKLKHTDFERMEESTFKLFAVMLVAFLATFSFNLLLYQSGAVSESTRILLNALFAGVVSIVVLFTPQAIVLDNASIEHAFTLSASIILKRLPLALVLLTVATILVLVNSLVFLSLASFFSFAPLIGIAVNALLIVPFLEVLKVQIYLSKYNLL